METDGNTHRKLPICWRSARSALSAPSYSQCGLSGVIQYISTAISVIESLYPHGVANHFSDRFLSEDTLDWGCRPRAEIGGMGGGAHSGHKLVILTLILTIF